MGDNSKIQWCHHTLNPIVGCAKIAPECASCYAAVDTFTRVQRSKGRELWGVDADRHVTAESNWSKPAKWNEWAAKGVCYACGGKGFILKKKVEIDCEVCERRGEIAPYRARVFCASLSDVFEDRAEWIQPRIRLWRTIQTTPNLDWLLLTKRVENAEQMAFEAAYAADAPTWPRNLWLGTTAGSLKRKSEIDHLRRTSCKTKFLSVEPLLEDLGYIDLTGIAWTIIGGESGDNARPCAVQWIRNVKRDGRRYGSAVFVKQLGAVPAISRHEWYNDQSVKSHQDDHSVPPGTVKLALKDKKGGDWSEWPEDLRTREFPEVAA